MAGIETGDVIDGKIRDLVRFFRVEMIEDVRKELEADGVEGNLHMQALIVLSSACLTFARHVQETVLDLGGRIEEVAVDDLEPVGGG